MAGGREVQVVYDQLRPRERPQVSTRFRTSCEVGACIRWCDAVWSWREASTRAQVVIVADERERHVHCRDSVVLENCAMVVPRAEDLTGWAVRNRLEPRCLHERERRRVGEREHAPHKRLGLQLRGVVHLVADPAHQPLRREPVRVEVIGCRVDEEQMRAACAAASRVSKVVSA